MDNPNDWVKDAACRKPQNNHIDWFSDNAAKKTKAIEVCKSCPVKNQCRSFANENDEKHGIWGGVDRHIDLATRDECGKKKGIKIHLKKNEPLCDDCFEFNKTGLPPIFKEIEDLLKLGNPVHEIPKLVNKSASAISRLGYRHGRYDIGRMFKNVYQNTYRPDRHKVGARP